MLKEEWDGFIPGEAAAFIRVSGKPGIGCWGRPAVAIAGVGTGSRGLYDDWPVQDVGILEVTVVDR